MSYKALLQKLGFKPKENTNGIYIKRYNNCDGYYLEIDFTNEKFDYGPLILTESKTTLNFSQSENWVVFECVDRLLEKGYKPENIILEKIYPAGHGFSGRLDICVTREDGSEYLLIECKTYGKEFDKAISKLNKDGGQLFTYFKFSNKPDLIVLYASEFKNEEIHYRNEIVKIEDEYRTGDVKDFFDKWNKLTKDNGIFDNWVLPYQFVSKALTPDLLLPIQYEDSGFIFNQFLEILRHNVVSDKPNAFNKIFTLFLCKIYDEKANEGTNNELSFQWKEGVDDDISFQLRLTDLYKNGMYEFLEKKVTDFSETEFENKFHGLDLNVKSALLYEFKKIRLEKNNEFAIKEVYDEKSFKENAKVVKEVVELLQGYKIRYTKKQQYLSDFFELLLTTGLKQESGQFFTPVPIAQFIIKSLPIDSLVESKLQRGESNNLLPFVIDYAAGSGHFLTEGMHEIQRLIDQKEDSKFIPSVAKKIRNWKDDHFDWALDYIYGIEKDYRLVKVGKVGCYLHGDGLANVFHTDGLANFNHPDYKGRLKVSDKDFAIDNKQFDILISNPPYAVDAFRNNAREYYSEKDFELYKALTDNSSEIECLFLERAKQLLKDGGVAGVILPSSILSGTSAIYTKARELILSYFEIISIVELAGGTFMATNTKTVTLFLRKRNNYDSLNFKLSVERIFSSFIDLTINGIENPIQKYVDHVWDGITFADYLTLMKKSVNEKIKTHDIFLDYKEKIKSKTEAELLQSIVDKEIEKVYFFVLSYPQNIVLIKSGEKDDEKKFLGYDFSSSRGKEGIHPIKGKSIEACTMLFDPELFDNPKKASTYIYKAFAGDFLFPIDDSLTKNVSRAKLVDLLTFNRFLFNKNFTLTKRTKINIISRWEILKLSQVVNIVRGASPRPIKDFITNEADGVNWIKIGDVKPDSKYIIETKEKISPDGAAKSRFVKKGDFILSNSMSFGRPYIMAIDGCIHDGWLLLSNFSPKLNKDYLYYMLSDKIIQQQFSSAASGGTSVDNLNIEKVAYTQIPLPPLSIQEKIVGEINILEEKAKTVVTNDLEIQKESILIKYLN